MRLILLYGPQDIAICATLRMQLIYCYMGYIKNTNIND